MTSFLHPGADCEYDFPVGGRMSSTLRHWHRSWNVIHYRLCLRPPNDINRMQIKRCDTIKSNGQDKKKIIRQLSLKSSHLLTTINIICIENNYISFQRSLSLTSGIFATILHITYWVPIAFRCINCTKSDFHKHSCSVPFFYYISLYNDLYCLWKCHLVDLH